MNIKPYKRRDRYDVVKEKQKSQLLGKNINQRGVRHSIEKDFEKLIQFHVKDAPAPSSKNIEP